MFVLLTVKLMIYELKQVASRRLQVMLFITCRLPHVHSSAGTPQMWARV
jgi:hypothetical protein